MTMRNNRYNLISTRNFEASGMILPSWSAPVPC